MKLTLSRSPLAKALDAITKIVERRTTIPILSNVRLEASANGLTLSATNLDIEARTFIAADVATQGALTVPANTLHDIARKLNEAASVSLEAANDGAQLIVKSGRAKFTLQALPASDFPDMDAGEMSHHFTLPAKNLARAIQKTSFAISNEETRYYLNGVYMHTVSGQDGPMLRAVATDGHRLARFEMLAPSGANDMPGVIIPRKMVNEALRLALATEGDIAIDLSSQKIRLTAGPTILLSKLIVSQFPDYIRVIPTQNDKEAHIDRATLSGAIDRVSVVSSSRGSAIKLEFDTDRIALSVQNPDAGSAAEEVEIQYDAAPLAIGFNGKYLAEILATLDGDSIVIQLGDPGSPTILRAKETEDLLTVLMPMRV